MNFISLEQVVRFIETTGLNHLQVKNIGIGDPWEVNRDTDRIGTQSAYPTLFITPIESYLDDNIVTHSIDIMVFDLQDDRQIVAGQIQILSDTNQILSDIIKTVKSSTIMGLREGEIRMEAFKERFADGCAGWACRLQIQVPSVLSDCMNPTA